jgi:3-dehydroquinate dehydratase
MVNIVKVVTMAKTLDDALRLIEASRTLDLPPLTSTKRRAAVSLDKVGNTFTLPHIVCIALHY